MALLPPRDIAIEMRANVRPLVAGLRADVRLMHIEAKHIAGQAHAKCPVPVGLQKGGVFGPVVVEGGIRLGLVDRDDPVCEIVARKVIEIACAGSYNPKEIARLTAKQLGVPK